MKIINDASLPYKIIGGIIDYYINNNYEDTCYYGKIEYFNFMYKGNKYRCQIRYLNRYVEWRFYENN